MPKRLREASLRATLIAKNKKMRRLSCSTLLYKEEPNLCPPLKRAVSFGSLSQTNRLEVFSEPTKISQKPQMFRKPFRKRKSVLELNLKQELKTLSQDRKKKKEIRTKKTVYKDQLSTPQLKSIAKRITRQTSPITPLTKLLVMQGKTLHKVLHTNRVESKFRMEFG